MQKPKRLTDRAGESRERSRRDAGGGNRELAEATRKKGLAEAEAQRALTTLSTYFLMNKPALNSNWRFTVVTCSNREIR